MIRINNIEIPFSGTISLKLLSPIFNAEDSYSFPVTLPYSDELREALMYADHPDSDLVDKTFPAEISGKGRTFTCICYITDCTDEGVEVTFIDKSTFWGKVSGKYMTELADDIINLGSSPLKNLIGIGSGKYALPTALLSKLSENWGISIPDLVNYQSGSEMMLSDGCRAIVPMPYLHYAIKRIFNDFGYKVEGNIMENSYYKKLFLYNNVSIVDYVFSEGDDYYSPSYIPENLQLTIINISQEKEPIIKIRIRESRIPENTSDYFELAPNDTTPSIKDVENIHHIQLNTSTANTSDVIIENFSDIPSILEYNEFTIYSSNPQSNKTIIKSNSFFSLVEDWTDSVNAWIKIKKSSSTGLFEEVSRYLEPESYYNPRFSVYDVVRLHLYEFPELDGKYVQLEPQSEKVEYDYNYQGLVFEYKIKNIDTSNYNRYKRIIYSISSAKKLDTPILDTAYPYNYRLTLDGEYSSILLWGRIKIYKKDKRAYIVKVSYIDKEDKKIIHICSTEDIDADSYVMISLGYWWVTPSQCTYEQLVKAKTTYNVNNINLTKHFPNVLVPDFISNMKNYLGWYFFINENSKLVSAKRIDEIIKSGEVIDASAFSSDLYLAANENESAGIRLSVSDDSAFENVKALPADAVVKAPVILVSDLPVNEDNDVYRVVTSENKIYHFTWYQLGTNGTWEEYGDNYTMERGKESFIESNACFAFVSQTRGPAGMPILISTQPGANYKQMYLDHPAPMLIAANDGGLACIDAIDATQEHTLLLDGDKSLYDVVWKPYLDRMNKYRRDGTANIYFPPEVFNQFQFWQKLRIGSTNVLVKSIDVTLNNDTDEFEFGEAEVIRV
jgi:hypothetical protein